MKFRTPYDLGDKPEGLRCEQPTRTQQQFKDECEISSILRAHNLGQLVNVPTNQRTPLFDDVSDIPDFQESQNHIARSTEYFQSLPSGVRAQFNNSLAEFLSALNNPANRAGLEELGVLNKTSLESENLSKQDVKADGGTSPDAVQQPHIEAGETGHKVTESA